jgi:hypothetical protein
MFQTIQDRNVFVVDLKVLPELPITDGGLPALKPYAAALELAILNGIIKEPGKYGIEVDPVKDWFNIYSIQE